jgi:hypothetical protein
VPYRVSSGKPTSTLSTLRRFVHALAGELRRTAKFKDAGETEIDLLRDLDDPPRSVTAPLADVESEVLGCRLR